MGSCCRKHGFVSGLFFFFIVYCFFLYSCAAQRITRGQVIKDGESITSAGEKFVLGFFSPANSSTLRYAGIWYDELPVQSVVWVANRERPISGEGGVITIGNDGNLMVLDGNGDPVWSTNVLVASNDSAAVLMESGNLMLFSSYDGHDSRRALWESFRYPTDTFLPGIRVYVDVQAGEQRVFTSWKSPVDPSPGNFSMGIDPNGSPQVVIWQGNNRHWRSGYWTGLIFSGVPSMRASYLYGFRLSPDPDGRRRYFAYTASNTSDILKFRVTWDGHEEQQGWNGDLNEWNVTQLQPATECDLHNRCGAFGKCNTLSTSICTCIEGFEPKNANEWYRGDFSKGCIRKALLQCERNSSMIEQEGGGEKDGFLKVEGVKLPDFVSYVGPEDIKGCENKCLENCSCVAYTFVSGISCMIWSGDLIDVQHFPEGGDSLYIRVAHSELGDNSKVTKVIIIVVVLVVGLIFLSVLTWLIWRRKSKPKVQDFARRNNELTKADQNLSGGFSTDRSGPDDLSVDGQQGVGPELPLFNFSVLVAATNNFSHENKLGQGGFGPVYEGVLPGNQKIAIKRLSRKSGQGLEEFKNEITLIAKLQHRNLVRLLGCCIQGEEKMLIYEYMPNKSLDSFLFDPVKQTQLDWGKRFNIIEGIARGLLYLHRDSRLRIIHRDLKASNILLDEEMNPKISDFGMARIFGGNQNEANTNRVVGTYGYMAPEYAMEGLFSVKSDVYSFGILLLEIVSGHKNTSYRLSEYSSIKGYAWDLWDRGMAMELTDPSIVNSCNQDEVLRCIHIAMLCVQDSANHRPNMAAVVLMLESENATLPAPRQPTFTSMRRSFDEDMWHVSRETVSANNVTITTIIGR